MKKLLVTSAIAFFSSVYAQTEKGSWVVSGKTSLGFTSTKTHYDTNTQNTDLTKVSSFSIAPSAGYFVINNLAVGIELSFLSTKTVGYLTDPDYKAIKTNMGVMPTATYYFTTGSSFRPYLSAGAGYSSTTSKYGSSSRLKTNGYIFGGKAGFIYFLNPTAALDLGIGYNKIQEKTSNTTHTDTTFGANVGFSLFFK